MCYNSKIYPLFEWFAYKKFLVSLIIYLQNTYFSKTFSIW